MVPPKSVRPRKKTPSSKHDAGVIRAARYTGTRTCSHFAQSCTAAAVNQRRLCGHERALALVVKAEHLALQHAAARAGKILKNFDALSSAGLGFVGNVWKAAD